MKKCGISKKNRIFAKNMKNYDYTNACYQDL